MTDVNENSPATHGYVGFVISEECGHQIQIANGETITPCHLHAGHDGPHLGRCLGSEVQWTDDVEGDCICPNGCNQTVAYCECLRQAK